VSELPLTPFDTIESAQDYIDLLLEAIEETRRDVGAEIRLSGGPGGERRAQALQLVALNLNKLSSHVTKSRRILNDLRTLRRLLLEERKPLPETELEARAVGAS
jgi:hypothetical protein